jgi:outer membrane protein
MKKNICLIAALVLISFVFTNAYVLAAEKIGFINLREIMQNSIVGKKASEEFKKLYDKKSENIKATEDELKKMKDSLDKQGSVLNETARKDREAAYQRKLRDYQLLVDDTNKELKVRDEEIASKIIPEIAKVVRAIAEREKYTLVIDTASMPVAYHAKESEFSKKVVDEYNKAQGAKK